jgi:hypothetical protein
MRGGQKEIRFVCFPPWVTVHTKKHDVSTFVRLASWNPCLAACGGTAGRGQHFRADQSARLSRNGSLFSLLDSAGRAIFSSTAEANLGSWGKFSILALDFKMATPRNRFAEFTGRGAVFVDNVQSYNRVEPAIDLTTPSFLMFAWRIAGAPTGSP